MIYSLNGKLIHSERDFVVIECGGVGYKCMTSLNTIKTLPHINENAMLYTHMIVKEDNIELEKETKVLLKEAMQDKINLLKNIKTSEQDQEKKIQSLEMIY